MRQELKLGEVGKGTRKQNAGPQGKLASSRRADPQYLHRAQSASYGPPSPVTSHRSLITAFLIDTPTIRNGLNSLPCTIDAHSNRHSPEAPSDRPASVKNHSVWDLQRFRNGRFSFSVANSLLCLTLCLLISASA